MKLPAILVKDVTNREGKREHVGSRAVKKVNIILGRHTNEYKNWLNVPKIKLFQMASCVNQRRPRTFVVLFDPVRLLSQLLLRLHFHLKSISERFHRSRHR